MIPDEKPLKAVVVYEQVAKRIANFQNKRQRRKFISTAASETERERPADAVFYEKTVAILIFENYSIILPLTTRNVLSASNLFCTNSSNPVHVISVCISLIFPRR